MISENYHLNDSVLIVIFFVLLLQKSCRNIHCYPGKVLQNGECTPLIIDSVNLCYRYAAHFKINLMDTNYSKDVSQLMNIFLEGMPYHLENQISTLFRDNDKEFSYVISNSSCDGVNDYVTGHYYFQFCIPTFAKRLDIEKTLLKTINSSFILNVQSFMLNVVLTMSDEAFDAPNLMHDAALTGKCILYTQNKHIQKTVTYYRVNELLLCKQVEFYLNQYSELQNRYIKIYNAMIGPNDYLKVKTGVRICTETFLQLLALSHRTDINLILFGIRVFCTTMSLICLLCTFITYVLFKKLRTLPGVNIMVLVLCLILNAAVFYIRLFDAPNDTFCILYGMLQHYFFLCCFTSFNICTYHIYRVFASKNIIKADRTFGTLCKYFIFIFCFPALFVAGNTFITRYLYEHNSIGYGGKQCFIILKEGVIYMLLCPISLIIFVNIFLFVAAFCHICRTPNFSSDNSTRGKRNDINIFIKLLTITGSSWSFQIIDSFFPESFFSVIVSMCSLLTGVFIFLSYVCNERVYNMYKKTIFCSREKGPAN